MSTSPSSWRWPALIAHRGAGGDAPENTLAAIRHGVQAGFGMVEFDVQLSRDGVPFLLHDEQVDRTSNGRGRAADLDWRALSLLDFGSWHGPRWAGEPPAALVAVARYVLANAVACNIEIKPAAGLEAHTGRTVGRAVAELWAQASTPPLLSSFSETALDAARACAPAVPRALLIDGPVPADWRERLRRLACIGLNLEAGQIGVDLAAEVRGTGHTLAAWTVNDRSQAQALFAMGCQAIFTDAIEGLNPRAFFPLASTE